jgi:hypothetical protein
MTAMDTLVRGMNATHRVLDERLTKAAAARPDRRHARDQYPAIDTFLASASRHNAAVLEVLVPVVRDRMPDGEERAQDFVHRSKEFEIALFNVKAKAYGSTYAIKRSWNSIWDDVRTEFDATWALERQLVKELDSHLHDDDPDWGEELYHAELHAPTRPHPYVPHRGLRGRLARFFALRVDRFWDTAEGRMIPEPVTAHDHSHDGKVTQYLLADPHFDEEEAEEK